MNPGKRKTYWQRTRRLTILLLLAWLLTTFGITWFARELNEINFFGFPLGFYMGAQGILLIYPLIIWLYNQRMRTLEKTCGIDDE